MRENLRNLKVDVADQVQHLVPFILNLSTKSSWHIEESLIKL